MESRNKVKRAARDGLLCLFIIVCATCICFLFENIGFLDTSAVMLYMIAVLFVAIATDGFVYGIVTALIAMVCFNFFFVPPQYSFNVANTTYIIELIMMLLAAIITSMTTSRSKMNERAAKAREIETTTLLRLMNQISGARDMEDIAAIVVESTCSILNCDVAFAITEDDGSLCDHFLSKAVNGVAQWKELWDRDVPDRLLKDTERHEYVDGIKYRDYPIYGEDGLLGVLRLSLNDIENFSNTQMRMFVSMKETAGLAMGHLRARRHQLRDNVLMEKERYRATLLRSISHDLRTPLAGIMGTAGVLNDMIAEDDEKAKLVQDISQDAQWLYELVENVLSLTRLRDKETLNKEPEACEEVIEAATRRIRGRSGSRRLGIVIPQECLMVPMNVRLIEQVLVNLLDNAVKHTPDNGEIGILLEQRGGEAVFTVLDNGNGILNEDLPHVFELFYTKHGVNTDKRKGMGIGLAICEAIVKAHGGSISAMNRDGGGGAKFQFTLPLQ